ncbi:MAG: NAD(P)/FAD-dependent oxidoreductase [Bryobacteraceae bacterium]|nr:NAD(P)/FAD-dependent oxidoreductase [Bryobacteraceae bacterium]
MRFVIIGNGVAGATAALALRARDPDASITMISGESDYFFSRTALMYAYLDRMTLRDLEPYERQVWTSQRIERVRGWVRDLHAPSKTLTLDSSVQIGYDKLLIATGSVARDLPWVGWERAKRGLVHFVTLADLERCEQQTRRGGKAVVVGGGLIGVELVECLIHHGMQVTFLVREPWYWPAALGGEEGLMISDHIRRHGVTLLLEETVNEVECSGDGHVQAVITDSGRRYDCELLGVTAGVKPAAGWLAATQTPPRTARGILTDAAFRTSLPDVWAAGDCAEIEIPGAAPLVEQIWYSAKRQGEQAALSMLGDPVDYRPPIFFNSSKFFDIEFTTVGRVNDAPAGSRQFYWRAPEREASIRIVEAAGAVIGFNMLGSRWEHTILERWISERRPMEYVMPRLREAQFDVEFGRLDLAPALEKFLSRGPEPEGAKR